MSIKVWSYWMFLENQNVQCCTVCVLICDSTPDSPIRHSEVMIAPKENLSCRTYNVHAMSFTPKELFDVVKRRVPELEIVYKVDGRQKIGTTGLAEMGIGYWVLLPNMDDS